MMGPDSAKCKDAMKSDIESMYENQVWNLLDPPKSVNSIECKWIYKKKTYADGNVTVTINLDLTQKGFLQIQRINYDDTTPIVMLEYDPILLAVAAYFDYETW